jgi:acetyl esterase/lipase
MTPRAAFLLAILALAQASAPASRPASPASKSDPVRVLANVAYHAGDDYDDFRHRLDLYLPAGAKGYPSLVFFHGGAWVIGSKEFCRGIGPALARRGIGVACPSYRLSPMVKHPEHVRDAARAFAWWKEHAAEHGADPGKIFVGGHSAGGHLAALVALDGRWLSQAGASTRDVRGALCLSAPFRLGENGPGAAFPESGPARADAEPIHHVGGAQPPFLIVVAERDMADLREQGEQMRGALAASKSDVELVLAEGKTHLTEFTSIGAEGDPTTESIVSFVRARASGPAWAATRPASAPSASASAPAR